MGQGGHCLEQDLAENQPKQETSLKEGVLFIRDAKERESPRQGRPRLLLAWQEALPDPHLLLPGAGTAQQDVRNLRGPGLV